MKQKLGKSPEKPMLGKRKKFSLSFGWTGILSYFFKGGGKGCLFGLNSGGKGNEPLPKLTKSIDS
jgi:hypothetical protein